MLYDIHDIRLAGGFIFSKVDAFSDGLTVLLGLKQTLIFQLLNMVTPYTFAGGSFHVDIRSQF